MEFNAESYGPQVAQILAIDGHGLRPMPLVAEGCPATVAGRLGPESGKTLFGEAAHPNAALAGLWLYFSGIDEAHALVQDDGSAEGSLWHAILHRQEPDSGNSAYWYRRAGQHPTHYALSREAKAIVAAYPQAEFRPSLPWDPFGFVMLCDRARTQPGSQSEAAAIAIQLVEWQLLFDYCARKKS
jgi:hypothetical protein